SIIILLFGYSCKSKQTDEVKEPPPIVSTEYRYPSLSLPAKYHLSSIAVEDISASYTGYYLQSNLMDKKKFNEMSLQFVIKQIKKEQSFIGFEEGTSEHSYTIRPTEVYTNGKIISVSNIIDTYTAGGNHHNYVRCSFNYDFMNNRIIELKDVFEIRNNKDMVKFINYVEKHTTGCSGWGESDKTLDFSFEKGGININPDLSWACTSTRAWIPINPKTKFIKIRWLKTRGLFGINSNF
ncbi:MAG: hypothetical protein AAF518_08815, partial [Spirochaetota bacterium]